MTFKNALNPFTEDEQVELKQIIYQHGTKITYAANQLIFSPGDNIEGLFFIDKGRVRTVSINCEGEQKVLLILEKGSFINEAPLLDDRLAINNTIISLITEIPTVLYKIDNETFGRLWNTSSIFRDTVSRSLSKKLYMALNHIVSLSFNTCKERLYELFSASVDKDSQTFEGWYKLKHQYTQYEMANIIGASRVTVTNLISELCEEGLIRIINRKIEVRFKYT